ncbi:MAG: sigma-70 family RNA polymerase sigma factor [Chitinispirillaceae bacterium]|nr:sigma-70 family RNA polymerase sigma factor [Chitinispirillaceae bacterium]
MKCEIVDNGLNIPYIADNLIARKCHKLERMLHMVNPEEIRLAAEFYSGDGKKVYRLKLSLKLPQAALNVQAVDPSIVDVCGTAFMKLFNAVSELKTTLRANRETAQKREEAQHSLEGLTIPPNVRSLLASFFSNNYGRFYNYALREIRFRSYQGYTKPGSIDVNDVLDEALLSAARHFSLDFNEEKATRIYYDEIRKSIDRLLLPGGMALVPVEEPIEPEDIDTDYQEYYQPDEIIKVEDVLIDADTVLPEQEVEYREIETHIDKLLSQLPADWRNAFILLVREGLPLADIAENQGKSLEEITGIIEQAKEFIRKKLLDSGFHWKEYLTAT